MGRGSGLVGGVHWLGQRNSAMQVNTPMADALGKYLDLTADQMKLTAGNIANIDTPGFKTQGFDFEQQFSSALASNGDTAVAPNSSDVDGLVARPDGNTVSLDRESLQLAKTQMQFRMGVEFLKHEYSNVMAAIHADAK
jgi:flagellar basal-body rod protein FlgB